MSTLTTKNLTVVRRNGALPSVPFLDIKNKILSKDYNLTIIFNSVEEQRCLNRTYRGKDYATNVLSFPYDEISGELYIQLSVVRRGAKDFGMSYSNFLVFLIIHGCLHLKGLDHGSTMEKEENKFSSIYIRE